MAYPSFVENGDSIIARIRRPHLIPSPTFGYSSLLAKREDYLERFQTFYERRPHPVYVRVPGVPRWSEFPSHVAEFTVNLDDIENIIAFVETLRKK